MASCRKAQQLPTITTTTLHSLELQWLLDTTFSTTLYYSWAFRLYGHEVALRGEVGYNAWYAVTELPV